MGQVAERQGRRAPNNGEEPLRPRAGSGQRVVPGKSTQADPEAARPFGCDDAGPLCLLRYIGQLSTGKLVRRYGSKDLAEVVVAAGQPVPLGSVQRALKATSSAGSPDRPSLQCRERSSPVKNRKLEICTSGSVGGGVATPLPTRQGRSPCGWRYAPSLTASARAGHSFRVGRGEETDCPGRTRKLTLKNIDRPRRAPP